MKYSSKWIVILFGTLAFMACQNLFNPSGTNSDVDLGAEGLIDYGKSLLQSGDNKEAAKQFDAAIQLDSTKSEAYYGLAKATLRIGNFNPLILAEAAASLDSEDEEEGQKAVQLVSNIVKETLGESGDEVNETKSILEVLIRRDSINQLWENYKEFDNNKVIEDGKATDVDDNKASKSQIADFILFYNEYVSREAEPNYLLTEFPIMDGKITSVRVDPEYQLLTMVAFSNRGNQLGELLGDSTILQTLADGGEVSFDAVANEDADEINALLDEISNDAGSMSIDPNLLGSSDGDEGDSLSDTDVQDLIEKAGNTIVFYKMNDQLDNDGDGCVDEEIRDGIDNDGDGIIDEDSRPEVNDVLDNNLDNVIDDAAETPNDLGQLGSNFEYDYSGTYIRYLDSLDVLTAEEVEARKNAADSVRYDIITDFLGVKYTRQQKKALVGGCW